MTLGRAGLIPRGALGGGGLTLQDGAVNFDGTNDFLNRGAILTGSADTDRLVIAAAFKRGTTGAGERIVNEANTRAILAMDTADHVEALMRNAAGTNIAALASSSTFTDTDFHTVLFAIDVSNATSTNNFAYLYVDDVQEAADEDIAQDTIDAVTTDFGVGALPSGNQKFTGCLGPIFWHHGVSLDLTVEANRRKFWNANGTQADWGADGSTPLGVQPLLYLDRKGGTVADYIANKGSGGGMTENGALAVC